MVTGLGKYLVLQWSATNASLVTICNNRTDARAAAAAVSLVNPNIGAGYFLLAGSESLTLVQGVPSTGSAE